MSKEIGEFAGKIHQSVKDCKAFYDSAKSLTNIAGVITETLIVVDDSPLIFDQTRKLEAMQEDTIADLPEGCQFCITEEHFLSFFEGYIDGHALIDKTIIKQIDMEKCLVKDQEV